MQIRWKKRDTWLFPERKRGRHWLLITDSHNPPETDESWAREQHRNQIWSFKIYAHCTRHPCFELLSGKWKPTPPAEEASLFSLGACQVPAASALPDMNIPNANIACCPISQYTILKIKSSQCLITLLKDLMLIHFKLWITFNSQLEQAAKFCFLCSQVAVPDVVENIQKNIKSLGKAGKL